MSRFFRCLPLAFLLFALNSNAQVKKLPTTPTKRPVFIQNPRTEKEWIKAQIDSLTRFKMHGRGYVYNGKEEAAKYLIKQFKENKMVAPNKDGSFTQGFSFPVNTFPGKQVLMLNEVKLRPGEEYLIDPASPSWTGENVDVEKVNMGKIKDSMALKETIAGFEANHAYYLDNTEALCMNLKIRLNKLVHLLPQGCFIIPEKNKLTWNLSKDQMAATVFYVKDASLPKKLNSVSGEVHSVFLEKNSSYNVAGIIQGQVKDTFIAITSHYDHLGMMGDSATFDGASDNASGVAMMLSVANYFSKHPQHYSLLFVAFAGEEAGLLGSEFFVGHPLVPLKSIKFVTSIGVMSDVSNGITVVNSTDYPIELEKLQELNTKNSYMKEIRSKGQAANSNHYYFSNMGVPAIFMYSNGGKEHYHDVFDAPELVNLSNVGAATRLLMDFIKALN